MKGIKVSIAPAPYNTTYRSDPQAGIPSESWWLSGCSRQEFDAKVRERREAMAKSRLGRAVQLTQDEG